MAEKVLAAVRTAPSTTEIREFPMPEIAEDAALMQMEVAGICGTDVKLYKHPPTKAPVIMGHENVGVIEELGPIAAARWGLRVGDRIALHEYLPCWHCRWCLEGRFGLCVTGDMFTNAAPLRVGTSSCTIAPHLWGGFAQLLYLPPNAVIHRVPDGLGARVASLAIPFGNGFQWAVFDGGANVQWTEAPWLAERQVGYRGDIDTWGFHYLATVRACQPHMQPILMNLPTLEAHRVSMIDEKEPNPVIPDALDPEEKRLYQDLLTRRHGGSCLEQERLSMDWVHSALSQWQLRWPG